MEGLINTPEYYFMAKYMREKIDVSFIGAAGETLSGKYLTRGLCKTKDRDSVIEILLKFITS